ncbi:unnamed protein product [Coregonus sp. 'balchen']|nr:unnamed protein product [Coregonus sp. 'balchen']
MEPEPEPGLQVDNGLVGDKTWAPMKYMEERAGQPGVGEGCARVEGGAMPCEAHHFLHNQKHRNDRDLCCRVVTRGVIVITGGGKLWTRSLAFQLAGELFQQNMTLVKWNNIKLRELQDLLARQNMPYSECVRSWSETCACVKTFQLEIWLTTSNSWTAFFHISVQAHERS